MGTWIFYAVVLVGVIGAGLLVRRTSFQRARFEETISELPNVCRLHGWEWQADPSAGEYTIRCGEWTCRYGKSLDEEDTLIALDFCGPSLGHDFMVITSLQHEFVVQVVDHQSERHKKVAEGLPQNRATRVLCRSFELKKLGRSQSVFRLGTMEYFGVSVSEGVLSHLCSPSCQAMVEELVKNSSTPARSMRISANRMDGEFRCSLFAVPASAQFVVDFMKLAEQLSRA